MVTVKPAGTNLTYTKSVRVLSTVEAHSRSGI